MIVDEYAPTDVRVMNEASILLEAGHQVFVLGQVYSKSSSEPNHRTQNGIVFCDMYIPRRVKAMLKLVMNRYPKYEKIWARAIQDFAHEFSIEVLHVHDLYMSRAAHMASLKVPMILDLHENYPSAILLYRSAKSWWQRLLSNPHMWALKEKVYLGYADHIVVLSESFKDQLSKRYPDLQASFTVLPNLPKLSRYNTSEESTHVPDVALRHDVTVLYFGRIAQRRGVFTLLDAIVELKNRGIYLNCLFIGPVDRADRAKFDQYMAQDDDAVFYYVPWIDQSELPAYGALVDICIAPFIKNPQHESGVANKIYQYMMLRKPLIVSNCRPQQDVMEKYDCGLVFLSEDVDDLCDKILTLKDNPVLRAEMGDRGRRAVEEDLNLNRSKDRLVALYNRLDLTI